MTEEESKMIPIRRLWAAVLGQAITDYRHAVMYYDDAGEDRIRRELDAMGYGKYVDMLQYGARRFRRIVTDAVTEKPIPAGKYRRMDCPACDGERTVWMYNRKRSVCVYCTACGLRYKVVKEL